jgi:hypothetical protein
MIMMSDYSFIQNADKALADIVWNSIKQEPKVTEIVSSEEQISFSSPKTSETKKPENYRFFCTI